MQSDTLDDNDAGSHHAVNDSDAGHAHRAQYKGEDVRATSDRELKGWYSYAFAAEVFVVCGVGSIIPITLEQLARENGRLLADPTRSCSSHVSTAAEKPGQGQCIVTILGVDINTASFAMYTFSISVLFQALLIITMSGAADHGRFRKKLLLAFAVIGSVATMLFLPITPSLFVVAALLTIIANTCFGASFVLLNSFLPLLVRYHPQLQRSQASEFGGSQDSQSTLDNTGDENVDAVESSDSTTGLLDPSIRKSTAVTEHTEISALSLSAKISANGISIGYIAAILLQLVAVAIIGSMKASLFSLRLVLFLIGAWWLVFSVPSALWLRPRPGPPLEQSQASSAVGALLAYLAHAWRSLFSTILHARKLRDVVLFLAAWFLLSDAIATISGTAVLFAKTTLGMSATALAAINVVVMVSGVVGAISWSRLATRYHLTPAKTILACLAVFELIPLYALLGYLPFVQRIGVIGLQQPWEMYMLGVVFGFVLGGLGSYCRAVYGELIPPGSEAAFYALYAITDKGSSVFGPAVVGFITDATGEIRPAFWFLAVLIGLPIPLLALVDLERGRANGRALAQQISGVARDYED